MNLVKKHESEFNEFKLPAMLNQMIEAIMTMERGMIKHCKDTVRFPFVGSLLTIAKVIKQ